MTRTALLAGVFWLGLVVMGGHAQAQDPAAGERVFRACMACHALEEGKNKVGPHLHGLFGREAGSVEGFRYSPAMAESGIVWNEETLKEYLANPRQYIPGNRMVYPGGRNEQDLENLIAYLRTLSDDPAPLPEEAN